jgi:hypothetical protein
MTETPLTLVDEESGYDGISPADETESRKVATAFLVIIEENGGIVCTNEMDPDIELDRVANLNDMFIGCSVTLKDLTALETSQRTAQVMMEVSQQIAEAAQKPKKSGLITPTMKVTPR